MLLASSAVALAAPPLVITAEHSPPASMRVGDQVVGRESEKIREMLARTGFAYSIDVLPWKRAFTMAQRDPYTCVYSTSRTPEREKQFKWVGPTDEAQWVLMGRAGRKYDVHSLDDARKLRIGTYNGDARDEFLRARGFDVDGAPDNASNPKKLLLDRIDLWAVGVRNNDLSALALYAAPEQIVPVLTFHHVKVYLACNPSVPDAMVARMNAALDAMRKDGTFTRLEKKYEQWQANK
ncbi:ABC transporter substrate-binding protein [Duganella sp. Root1480D1]|uniref:substrate-binding periplasmic protein n=1 Tax=Duganella sp. Root1480D1 TaxID=1736471 RepID=UPI000708A303|nr:transporter substrate-binding domain-containing protein [Duganella sp. Root1480D1]KQZ42628.1 ABC transporter substrate-binding protein [Duganella sp. Root1480D1]